MRQSTERVDANRMSASSSQERRQSLRVPYQGVVEIEPQGGGSPVTGEGRDLGEGEDIGSPGLALRGVALTGVVEGRHVSAIDDHFEPTGLRVVTKQGDDGGRGRGIKAESQ